MKNWIDKHFQDFMEDRSLVASFLQFTKISNSNELDPAVDKAMDQVFAQKEKKGGCPMVMLKQQLFYFFFL